MNRTNDRRDVKLQTFQLLWQDFPELWKMCDCWNIHVNAIVPIVSTISAEILNQRVIHDEWWVVLHDGRGAYQQRWVVELDHRNRNLRTALKSKFLLDHWLVVYIVCRVHGAQEKQQLMIYKPAKGQTINDMCFNLKTVV